MTVPSSEHTAEIILRSCLLCGKIWRIDNLERVARQTKMTVKEREIGARPGASTTLAADSEDRIDVSGSSRRNRRQLLSSMSSLHIPDSFSFQIRSL